MILTTDRGFKIISEENENIWFVIIKDNQYYYYPHYQNVGFIEIELDKTNHTIKEFKSEQECWDYINNNNLISI